MKIDERSVACGGTLGPDAWIRDADLTLWRCRDCGTLTSLPRPGAAALAALHDREAYFEHPYLQLRRASVARVERRCRDVFERIRPSLPAPDLASARHLDIGCDTGLFASAFSRLYGTIPMGLDIARRAVDQAVARGVDAATASIEGAPERFRDLDIITAIDVIEHVDDPHSFLAAIAGRLSPRGVLYLDTPNPNSVVYRVGRGLALAPRGLARPLIERLFPREHVQYFTRGGIKALARRSGLRIETLATAPLAASDIATGSAVRAGMTVLQWLDRISGEGILHCGVFRKA